MTLQWKGSAFILVLQLVIFYLWQSYDAVTVVFVYNPVNNQRNARTAINSSSLPIALPTEPIWNHSTYPITVAAATIMSTATPIITPITTPTTTPITTMKTTLPRRVEQQQSAHQLEKWCVCNKNTNFMAHPLYKNAEFLPPKPRDDVKIDAQYQNVLNFLQERNLTKIIIYGLRGSIHTHRWIHYGWFRSWLNIILHNSMHTTTVDPAISVCWIDRGDEDVPPEVYENALIFSSYGKGVYDYADFQRFLNNTSSVQVLHLHNFDDEEFASLPPHAHHWYREEFRKERTSKPQAVNGLFLEWATDLNPLEIEANRPSSPLSYDTSKGVVFCGTLWYQNVKELQLVSRIAGEDLNMSFHQYGRVSLEKKKDRRRMGPKYINHPGYIGHRDQYETIHDAFLAPAIQGRGHLVRGYIPCRIFKTISAGKLGITNNGATRKLFPNNTILVRHGSSRNSLSKLFQQAVQLYKAEDRRVELVSRINAAMTVVQQEHTYLARFNTIVNHIRKTEIEQPSR